MNTNKSDGSTKKTLVLGSMPLRTDPAHTLAAGPWCFTGREDFFPDWETRFTFAPEPLTDRTLQARAVCEAETLAADMIPVLAGKLAPGSTLGECYWEFLLAPYVINVARMLVETWHRVCALVEKEGTSPLRVELLPGDCVFDMGQDSDVILHGALNPVCLHWLFSLLLRPVAPRCWSLKHAEAVYESYPSPGPAGLTSRLRNAARSLALMLPVPPLKGFSLSQSLRWSLALCHTSKGPDKSRSLRQYFSSEAGGPSVELPIDPAPVFMALLPRTLRHMRHPASVSPLATPRTRLAGIHVYEDAHYRQKIAIWRARGGRVAFMQHGGNYGMMRLASACEFVEYTQHAFITWGWSSWRSDCRENRGQAPFLPLPSPQLARVRDAWTGGDERIIFVGTEMPGFNYQMDSHPTALQNLAYRDHKVWLLESLGRRRRQITFYRPYFPVPCALDDATWLLPQFPRVRLYSGPLLPGLLKCRLLILDHHGTTLLEAMAANVPTVCYWQPAHWPVTPSFQRVLLALGDAGVWHSSPESAGAHIDEMWPTLLDWWRSDKVQNARLLFLENFAQCSSDAGKRWLQALRSL